MSDYHDCDSRDDCDAAREERDELKAENARLRAALRPFAASFQIGAGYNRDDFQRASEAYGMIDIQQESGDK